MENRLDAASRIDDVADDVADAASGEGSLPASSRDCDPASRCANDDVADDVAGRDRDPARRCTEGRESSVLSPTAPTSRCPTELPERPASLMPPRGLGEEGRELHELPEEEARES